MELMNQIPDIKLTDTNFRISPLPLNNWVNVELSETVIKTLNNFRNYYRPTSNEASLRGLLWDPLLIELFTGGSPAPQNFDIDLEWKVDPGNASSLKVDFTVSPSYINCPILYVEVGTEDIVFPFSHKDSVKVFSTLTVQCIEFCKQLEEKGLDPSKAKVFGLWIGGPRFQMAVAEPVITTNEDTNTSDIHVVITAVDHWQLSVMEGDGYFENIRCDSYCCNAGIANIRSSQISFDVDVFNTEAAETTPSSDQLETTDDDVYMQGGESEVGETSQGSTDSEAEMEALQGAQANYTTVKKLAAFVNYIKDEIIKLHSLNSSNPYKPIEPPGFNSIPGGLSSSSSRTPSEKQVKFLDIKVLADSKQRMDTQFQYGPSDSTRPNHHSHYMIKKDKSIETRLYLKHFNTMYLFPHLIDISPVDNEGMVTYTFEKMSPLIDRAKMAETNQLASIDEDEKLPLGPFVRDYSVDSLLFDAVLFAVHTLYGLHVLHAYIGVVHSDISINNVMFSKLSNIWKLIDFEYALPIEVSLNNSRRNVGTDGFVAPESEFTGIYTEKSDVYSLGATIRYTFEENMWKDLGKGKRGHKNALILFKSLVNGMCETDPKKRLSVIDALSHAYSLLNRLIETGNYESFAVYGEDTLLPEVKRLLANVKKSEEIPFTPIL